MLDDAIVTLDANEVTLEVVVDLCIIKTRVVLAVDLSDLVKFLLESPSYERRHVKVEGWNSLTSVHLVLHGLHGDTSEDACCLDSLCRTRLAVAGEETVLEDLVERVLDTCQTLGRVVVLVMNVDVVASYSLLYLL